MQKNRKKTYAICAIGLAFVLALLSWTSPLQVLAETAPSIGILTDDPDMDEEKVIDSLSLLPRIKEIIRNLDFLSEEEVQALLDAEKISTPILAQIEELQSQENAIRESIREKYKVVFDTFDAIQDKTELLWKKIHEEESKNSSLDDPIALIQQSSLSDAEKKVLLDAEAELAAIDVALTKAEDELDEAISPILEQIEALNDTLYPLRNKLFDIFIKLEESEYYMMMVFPD